MFKNRTVFILGAGASWHYGYPTGEDLVSKVIAKAKQIGTFFRETAAGGPTFVVKRPKYIARDSGRLSPEQMRAQWERAADECEILAARLEQVNPLVIDYFLGQNVSLQPIGKLIIAWVILDCETHYLQIKGNRNRLEALAHSPRKIDRDSLPGTDVRKFKDAWYRFILNRLMAGCTQSKMLLENAVTFVTFNYDASLEYALYNGLRHVELFLRDDINAFLNNHRVIHVYGSIRKSLTEPVEPLPHVTMRLRPPEFGNDWNRVTNNYNQFVRLMDIVYHASQQIRTIDPLDKGANDDDLQHARHAIETAESVYVLGYGFDPANSARLQMDRLLRHPAGKSVLFTNFGNSNRISKQASKLFFGTFNDFLGSQNLIRGDRKTFYYEMSTRDVYEALELDFDSLDDESSATSTP